MKWNNNKKPNKNKNIIIRLEQERRPKEIKCKIYRIRSGIKWKLNIKCAGYQTRPQERECLKVR